MDSGQSRGQEGGGMTTNPEYSTKDLPLAAVLRLDGTPLIRIENYSGKAVFTFQNSPKVEEIISGYVNDTLRMSPRQLFDTWKILKSQAHSVSNTIR